MSYDRLRAAVQEAWDKAVDGFDLYELVITMRARCQAVIAADGMHTIW